MLRYASLAAAESGADPEMVFGQANFTANYANQNVDQSLAMPSSRTLSGPGGITVDAGRLWVADTENHRVVGYSGAVASTFNEGVAIAADIILGQSNDHTAIPDAKAGVMNSPCAVAVGADDTLWVVDGGNNRALAFANVSAKTTGAAADGVLGQPGFLQHDPAFSAEGMSSPIGLCVGDAGRLWVADRGNGRVLRFENAAARAKQLGVTAPKADGVLGQKVFSGLSVAIDASHVNTCASVYLDAAGTLWVSDATLGISRVMGFPHAATLENGAPAAFVLGQPGLKTAVAPGPPTAKNFGAPFQITGGPDGALLVVDGGFNRVLRFSPVEIVVSKPPAPSQPVVKISGAKKVTTPKAKLTIKGSATGEVTSVTYRIGSKPAKAAKGTGSWSIKVALKPGKNKITVTAHGPGGDSTPVKVTVTRKP